MSTWHLVNNAICDFLLAYRCSLTISSSTAIYPFKIFPALSKWLQIISSRLKRPREKPDTVLLGRPWQPGKQDSEVETSLPQLLNEHGDARCEDKGRRGSEFRVSSKSPQLDGQELGSRHNKDQGSEGASD